MTYREAKELLRDASGLQGGGDLTPRLLASPGELREFDSSTTGGLPEGDSLADQILRALLVVRNHLADQRMIERDLAGILVEITLPVRLLASQEWTAQTRIPQISIVLDIILHLSGAHASVREQMKRNA